MVTNNFALYSLKIVVEIITDILMFPVWWYTRGFFYCLKNVWRFLGRRQESISLFVWIKNIFKPMYGQTDWQGILISIFIRVVQIIVRSMAMIFWLFFSVFILLMWLVIPVFVIYEIVLQYM